MDLTPPSAVRRGQTRERGSNAPQRRGLIEIAIGSAWLIGIAAAVRIADLALDKNPLAAAIAGAIVVDFAAARAGVVWHDRPSESPSSEPTESPPQSSAAAGAATSQLERRGSQVERRGSQVERRGSQVERRDSQVERRRRRWSGDVAGGAATRSGARFVARRVGAGVAFGLMIVVVTVALGLAFGQASISMGMPSPVLGFALLQAAAISVRDELLYRGVVLAAAERAKLPRQAAAVYAALAGAAAIALLPESSPGAVILTLASGWLFARLWQRDRGAWGAVAAHAAWGFCAGPLLRGGLVDVTWMNGSLSPGPRAEGMPAVLASVICVAMVLGQAWLCGAKAREQCIRPV